MEKGEVAILLLQFGALAVVVLVVGNLIPGYNLQAPPTVSNAYWGEPANGVPIPSSEILRTTTNQSKIFLYFHLGGGVAVASASASRICFNGTGAVGESTVYPVIRFDYDTARHEHYLVLAPTGQRAGLTCAYTVQITDTLQQTAKWTGTIAIL